MRILGERLSGWTDAEVQVETDSQEGRQATARLLGGQGEVLIRDADEAQGEGEAGVQFVLKAILLILLALGSMSCRSRCGLLGRGGRASPDLAVVAVLPPEFLTLTHVSATLRGKGIFYRTKDSQGGDVQILVPRARSAGVREFLVADAAEYSYPLQALEVVDSLRFVMRYGILEFDTKYTSGRVDALVDEAGPGALRTVLGRVLARTPEAIVEDVGTAKRRYRRASGKVVTASVIRVYVSGSVPWIFVVVDGVITRDGVGL